MTMSLRFSKLQKVSLAIVLLGLTACGPGWIPTGDWQGVNKQLGCESADLENLMGQPLLSANARVQVIRDFINRCEKDLTRDSSNAYLEMFKFSTVKYDYMKSRQAEAIDFVDLESHKTRIALFMKPDNVARPMIIVKCGLQCDPGSTTLAILLMNLFDEGPFHVMLVPNVTGATYQRDNGIMPVGGFDEGRQLLKLAQWVQSPNFKYSSRVAEVHIAGVSLGGGGALYSALYASHNLKPDGSTYVKSVFAGCPVVDLEKSIDDLYDGSPIAKLFKRGFWLQIQTVIDAVPVLRQLIGDPELSKKRGMLEIPEIISRGALDYYKRATSNAQFNLAPFTTEKIKSKEDIWKLNRFQDYAGQVHVPVYVWAADNDKVVNPAINADLLKKQDPNIFHVLRTSRGNHCMFSDAYSWRFVGSVMRGIFESQSESLSTLKTTRISPLIIDHSTNTPGKTNWFAADSNRRARGVQWRVFTGNDHVELIAYGKRTCNTDTSIQEKACERGYSVQVLSFESIGLSSVDRPKNEVEAQALTRWLNSNVWVWGAQKGLLLPTEEPRQIEVRAFAAGDNVANNH